MVPTLAGPPLLLLLLLLVARTTAAMASEDCGQGKELVCVDTDHYKVCLPPELRRLEGDEPVVRCPASTRCDERSPWRCSAAPSPREAAAPAPTTYRYRYRYSCTDKGDFPAPQGQGDDYYYRCEAAGAEGRLRSCGGGGAAFDPRRRQCVHRNEQQLQQEEQQRHRRSKRGAVGSPHLLDLLFDEESGDSPSAPRGRREVSEEAAAGAERKGGPAHGRKRKHKKKKKLKQRSPPFPVAEEEEEEELKGKQQHQHHHQQQQQSLKEKIRENVEAQALQGLQESKGGEDAKLGTYSGIWMDRSKELLEQVKRDKERWSKQEQHHWHRKRDDNSSSSTTTTTTTFLFAEPRDRRGDHQQQRCHQQRHRQQHQHHGGKQQRAEGVLRDKGRRGGELVHQARRGKGSRAVYMVRVSTDAVQQRQLQQEEGGETPRAEDTTTTSTTATATGTSSAAGGTATASTAAGGDATQCFYTCGPATAAGATKGEEPGGGVTEGSRAEPQGKKEGHEDEEEEGGKDRGGASVKTLDFSGSIKVSEKPEKCDTDNSTIGSSTNSSSSKSGKNKKLLDINFDQLLDDKQRAAVAKEAGGGAGGGGEGRLYALPEIGARSKAEQLTSPATPPPSLQLSKKSAPAAASGVKAPPEGLAAEVQQQLRGGAVEMAAQEEDEEEEEEEEGGAAASVTARDVFRGRRDEERVDVNATLQLSNETFSPPVFSCGGRGGRFPDPASAYRYFSCEPTPDGATFTATRLVCPRGRVFDAQLGACVRRDADADALPPTSRAAACPPDMVLDKATGLCVRSRCDAKGGACHREQHTLTRRCRRPGRLANPADCASFFLCVPERRRRLVVCPRASVFDAAQGRCVAGDPGTCTRRRRRRRGRRCARPGRRFADASDDAGAYVLCAADLTPLRMRCPEGRVFSAAAGQCVAARGA